jgi:hypothetical protein
MSGSSTTIVIFCVELIIYSLVVYLLTSHSYGRDSLRWKTATIISTIFGLMILLAPIVFVLISILFELKGNLWNQENTESILSIIEGAFVLFIIVGWPSMLIIFFRTYYMTSNPYYSRVVEYFWVNPRLHDEDEGRPAPYLARYFQKWFVASYKLK